MTTKTLFDLKGGKALHDALQNLPVAMEKKIMRKALRRGANLIRNVVRDSVPRGKTLQLMRSVRVRAGFRRGKLRMYVIAGGQRDTVLGSTKRNKSKDWAYDAFYAPFVEFGTKTEFGGVRIKPGRQMSTAFKASAGAAMNVIMEEIGRGLMLYAKDKKTD